VEKQNDARAVRLIRGKRTPRARPRGGCLRQPKMERKNGDVPTAVHEKIPSLPRCWKRLPPRQTRGCKNLHRGGGELKKDRQGQTFQAQPEHRIKKDWSDRQSKELGEMKSRRD